MSNLKTELSSSSEILWSDRKRWLGMPLTFTKYSVDNDRLYLKTGFFKSEVNELLLYRILDIKSSRTLGQKLLGVGTVTLFCSDRSTPTLELKNIKDSDKVRKFLSNIIEARREERGIAGREIYGTGSAPLPGMDPAQFEDIDGDGIPDMLER